MVLLIRQENARPVLTSPISALMYINVNYNDYKQCSEVARQV